MPIERDTLIEELMRLIPQSVAYLMRKNIKCLACGEPMWGTIEEAARNKGYSDAEIDVIVRDLN
ncbi:MAG: DUF1858 domain-containing protein, partial [Chitinivibrionia bacterium]|nr:DUF1858 domain-containing protein [Chitinivibrionia bacterium]